MKLIKIDPYSRSVYEEEVDDLELENKTFIFPKEFDGLDCIVCNEKQDKDSPGFKIEKFENTFSGISYVTGLSLVEFGVVSVKTNLEIVKKIIKWN